MTPKRFIRTCSFFPNKYIASEICNVPEKTLPIKVARNDLGSMNIFVIMPYNEPLGSQLSKDCPSSDSKSPSDQIFGIRYFDAVSGSGNLSTTILNKLSSNLRFFLKYVISPSLYFSNTNVGCILLSLRIS